MSYLDTIPAWLNDSISWDTNYPSYEDLMEVTFDIAISCANHKFGPFGAVIADRDNKIIDVGWNCVLSSSDSTAHAEIVCLRRAQNKLKCYDFSNLGFNMFINAEPCIQCFGAIYWSGISEVYAGSTKEEVEKIGFDEGPISLELWGKATDRKGINLHRKFHYSEKATEAFRIYQDSEGEIY